MTGAPSTSSFFSSAARRPSLALLVGGAVLLCSLGAAAGWMAARHGQAPATLPTQLALAPNEAVIAPAAVPATQGADNGKPAPLLSPARPGTEAASAAAPAGIPTQAAVPAQAGAAPAAVVSPQPAKPAPVHAAPRAAQHGGVSSSSATALGSGTAAAQPLRTRPAAVCERCGTVEGVREVRRQGEAKGIGAVAGGVLGGLLGHQIGKGHGRDAMTVVGAVGGGFAGHEVEKRVRAETVYEVRVRMDDGRLRTLTQKTAPQPGARVTVDGSTLRTVATQDDGGRT